MGCVIAIDFDGTIIEDGHWPEVGPAIPGAIQAINVLHKAGYCIIINSCRSGVAEANMIRWLNDNNVSFCHVNVNCKRKIDEYGTDCRKISADIMIDDKSICFDKDTFSWMHMLQLIIRKYGNNINRDCNDIC